MPVGPTAKVRSDASADDLSARLRSTAAMLGLHLPSIARTARNRWAPGSDRPRKRAMCSKVLRNDADAPADLRQRSVALRAHWSIWQQAVSAVPARHAPGQHCTPASSGEVHGHLRGAGAVPRTATGAVHGRGHRHHERAYYRDRQPPPQRIAKLAGAPRRRPPDSNVPAHRRCGRARQVLFTMHAQSRGGQPMRWSTPRATCPSTSPGEAA